MANPFEFIQEVRAEVAKVTWPTQKETVVTTIMVLILVVLAAIFFFAADQVLNVLVQLLIGSSQS
jgi:preprotein translocase subunit SecE